MSYPRDNCRNSKVYMRSVSRKSSILKDKFSETGKYDSCPCGSEKEYKFCCFVPGGEIMIKQFQQDIADKLKEQNTDKIAEIFVCSQCAREVEIELSFNFLFDIFSGEIFGEYFPDYVSLEILHNNFTCEGCQKSYDVPANNV